MKIPKILYSFAVFFLLCMIFVCGYSYSSPTRLENFDEIVYVRPNKCYEIWMEITGKTTFLGLSVGEYKYKTKVLVVAEKDINDIKGLSVLRK